MKRSEIGGPGGLEHAPDDRRVAAHRERLPLRPRGVQELLAVGVGDDDRRAGRQGREEPLRLLAKAGQIAGPQGPRDGKPLQPGDRRLQLALDDERHAARDLERALGAAGAVVAIVQIRVGRREGDHRQHADDDEQRQPLAKRQAPKRRHGPGFEFAGTVRGHRASPMPPCRGVRVSGAIGRKRPLRAWQN